MKKTNVFKLGWIFAGSFLGAGFVSGQELWQFFGNFGIGGVFGVVVSFAVMMLFGIMIMLIANMLNSARMDEVVCAGAPKLFSSAIGTLQAVFIFGIITIMIAAAGELVEMLTSLPMWIGSLLMALLVAVISLAGKDGVATVFSTCVPLIVISTLVIAIISQFTFEASETVIPHENNVLLPNWFVAALTYATYNIFGSIGILTPFGRDTKSGSTVKGVFFGTVILLVISLSILSSLTRYPLALEDGLPMLALASKINPVVGIVYGIMLLMGLLGTSTSSTVAIENYASEKYPFMKRKRVFCISAVCFAAFLLSLFGFGNLVGTVYPIFGYLSIVLMVLITVNFFRLRKQKRLTNQEKSV